jgi:ankyrin repeat protein
VAVGVQGPDAMGDIWKAAEAGDRDEVEWLVGQNRGLLNARDVTLGMMPLMWASWFGHSWQNHVGVVQWLLDEGAAMDEQYPFRLTAMWLACSVSRTPVVRLLLERGADPTIANIEGGTPLMAASREGHLEVVHLLLAHPTAGAIINRRDRFGRTALWSACEHGHGGVVRALLASGADLKIANEEGITPTTIAKQLPNVPTFPPTAAGSAWRR